MDRRRFIAAGASGVLGLLNARAAGALAEPAGPLEPAPVGLQLYTLRELASGDLARALAAAAQAGYREIEFAGYFGHSAPVVRRMLDENGLVSPSAHVQLSDIGSGLKATVDFAAALGQTYLVVPWIDEVHRTSEGIRRIAARFNAAGDELRNSGIRLAYHNQRYDFDRVGASTIYETLLAASPPENLLMQLDVFWMRSAGEDPLAWIERHPGRFRMLHVKDMGPPPGNAMTDVGSGVIDWATIIPVAKRAGVKHYFVEHDEANDPVASMRQSFRHLRKLGLP